MSQRILGEPTVRIIRKLYKPESFGAVSIAHALNVLLGLKIKPSTIQSALNGDNWRGVK